MSSVEDCCVVCAEPILWTGFGPCGHKEVCARCVARMRFVLKDTRCALCQQDCPIVYFTRYMGDYTKRVTPDAFDTLKSKAGTGELYELPAVEGVFDDVQNYQDIKKLCSYTHPILMQQDVQEFSTLQQLKNCVDKRYSREFCSICLQSRKVFICEQLLYTKKELERHMKTGDETGPLAESGFKGHPLCRFCRTRFYGSEDLYKHMESSHEYCFICRRSDPDKYIYYRNYDELEEHFKRDHHLCPHPSCLEKKFIVFAGEAELKRHFAQEHGDELKMSRAQRREALNVPIQFQYRPRNQHDEAHNETTFVERPGVVIGGGNNVGSRVARRIRSSRSDPQLSAAIQASMDSSTTDAGRSGARPEQEADTPSFLTFSSSDFPSVSNSAGQSGIGTSGRWAGGSAAGPNSLRPDEFPSLPTMSRADKRRAKKDENARKTLAERLSVAAAQPRILHRATPNEAAPSLGNANFPTLGTASTSRAPPSPAPSQPANRTVAPAPVAPRPPAPIQTPAPPVPPPPTTPPDLSPTTSAPLRRASSANNMPVQLDLPDFPSLPSAPVSGNRARAAARAAAAAAAAETSDNSGANGNAAPGGVSTSLKAANKALIDKVKQKLSETEFAEFRKRSGDFMQSRLSAQEYHRIIVDLGLLGLAADMVALCPDTNLRGQLMAAHKEHLAEVAAADEAVASTANGWVPPEAALAAATEAELYASWACTACTLINAPQASRCEACGKHKSSPAPSRNSAARNTSNTTPASEPINAWQGADNRPTEDFPALTHRAVNNAGVGLVQGFATLRFNDTPQPSANAAAADKKKKKGKQQVGLGEFLQSQRPAPAGWGNSASSPHAGGTGLLSVGSDDAVGSTGNGAGSGRPARTAPSPLSPAPAVASTATTSTPVQNVPKPRGQWARNGGTKLAKAIGATNDAWGMR